MFGRPGFDCPGGKPAAANGIPDEGLKGIVGEEDVGDAEDAGPSEDVASTRPVPP